jgi:molybdopterin-guanine dinucleotide biosynthesis protein A
MNKEQSSSIQGFILAGGQSRRMGKDKAFLTIGGRTFLERIAAELDAVTESVTLVGTNSAGSKPGAKTAPDIYPNWGALGGVHAALAACDSDWALVVACDFPFVTRQLFKHLIAGRDAFEAVAPLQKDLIPQPLCTLYRVDPCLLRANELINSGERKPIALLQSVRTRWVSFDEVAGLQGSAHFYDNINSPEDYERIEKGGWAGDRDELK